MRSFILPCALAVCLLAWNESGAQTPTRPPASEPARNGNADPARALAEQAAGAFKSEDYRAAVQLAQRYINEGGADPATRLLLGRAYYALSDFENAARNLHVEYERAEKSAKAPGEDIIKLLANCYARLNDITGQSWALERLVSYYPRKEYWMDLIAAIQKKAEFGSGLMMDIWRLKLATWSFNGTGEYLQAINLALQSGYPADAKAFVERGFTEGALGTGPETDAHRRLRDSVVKQYMQEKSRLAAGDMPLAASVARYGNPLVNAGFSYVAYGDNDKGFALINQGIAQPAAVRPQYDKLHLGIASLQAGRRAEAAAIFKTVTGRQGAADLGRLWYLHAMQLR